MHQPVYSVGFHKKIYFQTKKYIQYFFQMFWIKDFLLKSATPMKMKNGLQPITKKMKNAVPKPFGAAFLS